MTDKQLKKLKLKVEDIVLEAYAQEIAKSATLKQNADEMPVFNITTLIDEIIIKLAIYVEDILDTRIK